MKIFKIVPPSLILTRLHTRALVRSVCSERGASTVEYVLVMLAGAAIAGVLLALLKSGTVQGLLMSVVQKAFG